jgi:hypothetical protein
MATIESKLIEWGEASEGADEDGLAPPSRTIVSVALQIASELRNAGVPIPLRMVQDGDGGIVFEWKRGARSDKLRLDASGRIEALGFYDSKLVYRYPISFSFS